MASWLLSAVSISERTKRDCATQRFGAANRALPRLSSTRHGSALDSALVAQCVDEGARQRCDEECVQVDVVRKVVKDAPEDFGWDLS